MRFLLSFLALIAVLMAPAGMLGSHAAMAMPQQAAASAGHCDEQQQHEQGGEERAMIDCALACTALPAREPLVRSDEVAPAAAPEIRPALLLEGMRPEAATPPPRFS